MCVSPSGSDSGKTAFTPKTSRRLKTQSSTQLSPLPPVTPEPEAERQAWQLPFHLQHCSRTLLAVVQPCGFRLLYGNRSFCQLLALDSAYLSSGDHQLNIFDQFQALEGISLEQLYRYHLVEKILQKYYQINLESLQISEKSVLVEPLFCQQKQQQLIRFWLNTQGCEIHRIDPNLDEGEQLREHLELSQLKQPGKLAAIAQKFPLENYRIEGMIVLEGIDVTCDEQKRRLVNQLLNRNLIRQRRGWEQIEQSLMAIFEANYSVILRFKGNKAKLSFSLDTKAAAPTVYNFEALENSYFFQSAHRNQVIIIPELQRDCPTECERQLYNQDIRSLLLIPLVIQSHFSHSPEEQILGIIGLGSDESDHFHPHALELAQELIPALITAFHFSTQQRLSNIRNLHPSVEWRFLQEAERRSWGLSPQPIVFEQVFPLYGISDIRGSSEERNRAIQADLLAQFHLGLAVIEAVCQAQQTALGEQLRQDLIEYITQIEEKITVEGEVRATDYLKTHLEIYFDYFCESSAEVEAAVQAYREACDNQHGCVYTERSRYDEMLNLITVSLQKKWNQWQDEMQKIIPHYCDVECSDGIDHMLYVGKSIDSRFSFFHLKSLRYEQLRAVCDCARTALKLKTEGEITLELAHLILVQHTTIDIFHDENTERVFDVRGTRDIRYEIVKKRIDKGVDLETQERITQTGKLTVVYSTEEEWDEYQQYLRYLARENWVESQLEMGSVAPLPGVNGLKYARVKVIEG
ncbi:MAG: GAF domain-containing protein [Lyngbya sp.]|nr:GAF domain-containing protein [Lyngbya sp.]